jgi:MFS family permease
MHVAYLFLRKQASSGTGLVFAMYNIGCISALPFAGPLNDHFGRRWGMFVGGFWVIAGTFIMAPAVNSHMFLFGRWCVGFGQGFLNVAGITYGQYYFPLLTGLRTHQSMQLPRWPTRTSVVH